MTSQNNIKDTTYIIASDGRWREHCAHLLQESGVHVQIFDPIYPKDISISEVQHGTVILLAVPGANQSSIKLIKEWGSHGKKGRLIVVAGSDTEKVFVRAVNSGAVSCLQKSFSPHLMNVLLKNVLAGLDSTCEHRGDTT